jgi:GNAT superfamily N-acetyltransferase
MQILEADLDNPAHQRVVLQLTDAYASDPMGNGRPLDQEVCERLIAGLRSIPTTVVLLAYDGDEPIGIATCFLGFSTFAGRPLLNIHDLAVLASHRRMGVGRELLRAAEDKARELGCCKVTLEVMEHNPARRLYEACGFAQAQNLPEGGGALFYTKAV